MIFPRDDDYQREDLEAISMNYGKTYPRVHPRSSFIGHGTGVLYYIRSETYFSYLNTFKTIILW